MSVYNLKKWFFDVLLHQDSYLFFYITELKFLGFKLSLFNLYYSSKDFKKSVSESIQIKTNNIHSFQCTKGSFYRMANSLNIRQISKEANIELKYEKYDQILSPINKNFIRTKNGVIDWLPITLKSAVSGTIILNSTYIPVSNNHGYIDYVQTNISPFKNPVRELFWGRLHSCELDLTYSIVLHKQDNKNQSCCICRYNNEILKTDDIKLKITQKDWSKKIDLTYPKKISVEMQFNTFYLILDIEQSKTLFYSRYNNELIYRKKFIFYLLKWFTKNPRGLKFLSKGEVKIIHNNSMKIIGTRLISEYVKFD